MWNFFTFKKNERGFTLVELLVVTTIVIVLTTIGLVSYQRAGQNARNGKRKADLEAVRQALVLYRTDEGIYPSGSGDEQAFTSMLSVISGYLGSPASAFEDPQGDPYVYTYESDGVTFTITALTEPDEEPYTVQNP